MKVIPISIVVFARKVTNISAELWVQKRRENGPLDGLLEFPGGKIEQGEDPLVAASREVAEEIGLLLPLQSMKLFKIYKHEYEDRSVALFCHLVLQKFELSEAGWIKVNFDSPIEDIADKVPAANIEVIRDVCEYLREIKVDGTLESLWVI